MKNKIEQFLELMMVGRPCVELRTVKPPKFKMFSDVTEASTREPTTRSTSRPSHRACQSISSRSRAAP